MTLWYHSLSCVCAHCLAEDLVFAPEFARVSLRIYIKVRSTHDLHEL